jgi:hypothetical protein
MLNASDSDHLRGESLVQKAPPKIFKFGVEAAGVEVLEVQLQLEN